MSLTMTSGPAIEPISAEEVKAHLRLETSAEDALIASLIITSRLHVEAALSLALIEQSWRVVLDRWPADGAARVPLRPIKSITAVRVADAAGVFTALDPSHYRVDASGGATCIRADSGAGPVSGRPHRGIEIDLVAGFGPAAGDVPAPIRHALILLSAHWYENRDTIEIGSPATRIPGPVGDLLQPYRPVRL